MAEAKTYDCIVLGAGIAGVTAARDLHREGFDVLLVEGAERIGGRMYSRTDFVRHPAHAADAGRWPLEAGAEYVHVSTRKRFPEFFAELEAHGFITEKYPKFERNRLAFPDWKKNPKTLPLSLLRSTSLLRTVPLLLEIEAYKRSEDVPVGAFVGRRPLRGKGIALGRYSVSSHIPGQLFDPAVDPEGAPGSDAVDDISVLGFQADQLPFQLFWEDAEHKMGRRSAGGAFEVLPYDELPRAIARQIEDPSQSPRGEKGEILLGHRVVKVERPNENGVVVTVRTPRGGHRKLEARSAICTFSVGMLSPETGDGPKIFGELLTDDKLEALRSIEMGPITKFSLEFKESFWGKKVPMTVMSNPRGRARTFFSAFPDRRGGPFVLTGLLMNQDHRIIQALDDEAAVQHLLDVLQRLFAPRGPRWTAKRMLVPRRPGSTEPNFLRQDWQRDPFARGGNSYIRFRPGLDRRAVGELRQTLRDARATRPLFWAGEATAPAYDPNYQPLAVHGAYRSGVGAARDVGHLLAVGPEAFRRSLEQELSRETAATLAAATSRPEPIVVHLTRDELAALRRHAEGSEGESDDAHAALELLRIGLYLHRNDPRAPRVRSIVKDPSRAVELTPSAAEVERLRAIAEEHAGGDLELTVRALLARALELAR